MHQIAQNTPPYASSFGERYDNRLRLASSLSATPPSRNDVSLLSAAFAGEASPGTDEDLSAFGALEGMECVDPDEIDVNYNEDDGEEAALMFMCDVESD